MKHKKRDWIKIRGISGLIIFIFGLVFTKVITVYNLFSNDRLLVVFILFMIIIPSLALFTRYYMKINKNKPRKPPFEK